MTGTGAGATLISKSVGPYLSEAQMVAFEVVVHCEMLHGAREVLVTERNDSVRAL